MLTLSEYYITNRLIMIIRCDPVYIKSFKMVNLIDFSSIYFIGTLYYDLLENYVINYIKSILYKSPELNLIFNSFTFITNSLSPYPYL